MLPAVQVSQYWLESVGRHADVIGSAVRVRSDTLTKACVQVGLPQPIAELCGGLLATVIDDLIEVGRMPRTAFERSKRKERILAAAQEPAAHALRLAIAASPINGRAAVAHWDVVCDRYEVGKLAWLLGMDTDAAAHYAKKIERLRK